MVLSEKKKKKKCVYAFLFSGYIDRAIRFHFLTEPTQEPMNASSSTTAGNRTILLNFLFFAVSTLPFTFKVKVYRSSDLELASGCFI